jgi:hypothetical protein
MKAFLLLVLFFGTSLFLGNSLFLNAQEGFWSIDQLPTLQSQLQSAGIQFPLEKIKTAQHNGLANTVIRVPFGNAVLVNPRGLAIGIVGPYFVPDSIMRQMKQGIWLAAPGQEIDWNGYSLDSYYDSKPDTSQSPNLQAGFFSKTFETQPDGTVLGLETHAADPQQKQIFTQQYLQFRKVKLIGVLRLPTYVDTVPPLAIILRIQYDHKPQSPPSNPYLPMGHFDPAKPNHLILGHPGESSIHRQKDELEYAYALAKCHQDLDRALGAYVTRPPFITQDGVFRNFENLAELERALPSRAIREAEFRHQLSQNPALKARYSGLLDSCHQAFAELKRFAPAQVYTKGVVYSPCSFFEAVRLFTMWRGKIGSPTHRLPTPEEAQYFPEVFERLPPTENELLLPELLQRYFTQLPADQLSPYAIRQAIYANKDYARLSETLLIKSKFSQPEEVSNLLKTDFLQNIDLIASDPAVQLVDSILQFYAEKVVPRMEKARTKAFKKAYELSAAMSQGLPNYPAYPDADHSLRISFGTSLRSNDTQTAYLLSNAHVLQDHQGSPVVNEQGELIGLVKGLTNEDIGNSYYYDPEKSRAWIWTIDSIRQLISRHPEGAALLKEWK